MYIFVFICVCVRVRVCVCVRVGGGARGAQGDFTAVVLGQIVLCTHTLSLAHEYIYKHTHVGLALLPGRCAQGYSHGSGVGVH